jgi:hypothetical protein
MLLPACGGGAQPGYRDVRRLEPAVRRVLEQRLMTSAPRQSGSRTPTHIQRVRCGDRRGGAFRCVALLGNGSRLAVRVLVSADGKRFAVR